jgi:hypothetical protein
MAYVLVDRLGRRNSSVELHHSASRSGPPVDRVSLAVLGAHRRFDPDGQLRNFLAGVEVTTGFGFGLGGWSASLLAFLGRYSVSWQFLTC